MAHNKCNLSCKVSKTIPIYFHNLSGYDAHIIVPELCKRYKNVNCIGKTKENYISFDFKIDKIKLRFIDSYRLLPASLDELSSNLSLDKSKNIKDYFGESADIMKMKGIYPYEYMDSFSRFE